MNKKALKTIASALALSAALAVPAHAASIGGATVTQQDAEFRRGADETAPVFATLTQDEAVVIGGKVDDNWYKVVYQGAVGYMSSASLNFSEELDYDFDIGSTHGENVSMFAKADGEARVLCTFEEPTELAVIGINGEWYKVSYLGVVGYVHSDCLALNNGDSALYAFDPEYSEAGQAIVDEAMNYLGVRYVWAGTSPSGFDCSGFVYYVYKECGYSINRTAALIYNNGEYVNKENLQVGDPICFSSSRESIGHVGIYIGNGEFIHASSGSGKVIISHLDETYYTQRYVGARRIV